MGIWLFELIKPSELLAFLLASSATLIALSRLSIVIMDKATGKRRYFIDKGIIAASRLFLRGGFFIWTYAFGVAALLMILHIATNSAPLIVYGLNFTCFAQVSSMFVLGIGWFFVVVIGLAAFLQGRKSEPMIEEMLPW